METQVKQWGQYPSWSKGDHLEQASEHLIHKINPVMLKVLKILPELVAGHCLIVYFQPHIVAVKVVTMSIKTARCCRMQYILWPRVVV